MNINNIFGGILGFIVAMSFIYIFWSPVDELLSAIGIAELKLFLQVAWVCFLVILGVIAPINLATSDDKGEQ